MNMSHLSWNSCWIVALNSHFVDRAQWIYGERKWWIINFYVFRLVLSVASIVAIFTVPAVSSDQSTRDRVAVSEVSHHSPIYHSLRYHRTTSYSIRLLQWKFFKSPRINNSPSVIVELRRHIVMSSTEIAQCAFCSFSTILHQQLVIRDKSIGMLIVYLCVCVCVLPQFDFGCVLSATYAYCVFVVAQLNDAMPHTYYAYTRPNFYWRRQNEHINAFYMIWVFAAVYFEPSGSFACAPSPLHGNRNFGHHIKWIRTLRNGRIVFDYWCVTEFVLNMLGCAACLAKNGSTTEYCTNAVWMMRESPNRICSNVWNMTKVNEFSRSWMKYAYCAMRVWSEKYIRISREKVQFQNYQCQTSKSRVYGDRKYPPFVIITYF